MSRKVSKKKLTATKKPARKRGSGSNPASRAGDANLNRAGWIPPDTPKPYPSDWENFLIEYKLRGGIRRAALECHIGLTTAMTILRDDRTPAIIKDLDATILRLKIEREAVRFVMEESDVDEQMFNILMRGGTPEQVRAGLVIYRRMKLIEPNRIINNNTAQTAAAIQGTGQDAFQVFESGWLTERKQQWGTELTQKVRHYLETSLPSDPSPNAAKGE